MQPMRQGGKSPLCVSEPRIIAAEVVVIITAAFVLGSVSTKVPYFASTRYVSRIKDARGLEAISLPAFGTIREITKITNKRDLQLIPILDLKGATTLLSRDPFTSAMQDVKIFQ